MLKQFDNFVLDIANECLWNGCTQIALQPKPFAVLRYLVDNPGRLITHRELLGALWPATYVQPQVLRTYMLELRKILGDDAGQPRFIQTLPKRGYCFVAPVAEKSLTVLEAAPGCTEHAGILDREAELAKLAGCVEALQAGLRHVLFLCSEARGELTAIVDALAEVRSALTKDPEVEKPFTIY